MNEIIFVFKVFVREEFIHLLSSYVRWIEPTIKRVIFSLFGIDMLPVRNSSK